METKKVVRPTRVAHIGIQATDVSKTRDWYCRLLNGEVAFEKIPYFSFVTFDDEHHRFAITALPGKPQERAPSAPAISHAAVAMADVFDLLSNYERARDQGIVPEAGMHHGATISLYYRDPDGSQFEIMIDRFKTVEETREFMEGPVFKQSFGTGCEFDPETKLARMKAGASEAELIFYDEVAAMKVDPMAEMKKLLEFAHAEPVA